MTKQQNKNNITLSPLGWCVVGVIIFFFWDTMLWAGGLALAAYLVWKYRQAIINTLEQFLNKLIVKSDT